MDPFENTEDLVFAWQRAFSVDDPPTFHPRADGIQDDPDPIRRIRMTEARLVFETPWVGTDTEQRFDNICMHDPDDTEDPPD